MRYDIPEIDHPYTALPSYQEVSVAFADRHFHGVLSGLRDPDMAIIDQESVIVKDDIYYTDVMTDTAMGIDEEGAATFCGFPGLGIDYYLDRTNYHFPAAGLHALLRLGVLSIAKGRHQELDRMLRMSNQLSRHGLKSVLNDSQKLIDKIIEAQDLDHRSVKPVDGAAPAINDLFDMDAAPGDIAEMTEAQYRVLKRISKMAEESQASDTTVFKLNDNQHLRGGLFGSVETKAGEGWFAITPVGKFIELNTERIESLLEAVENSMETDVVYQRTAGEVTRPSYSGPVFG